MRPLSPKGNEPGKGKCGGYSNGSLESGDRIAGVIPRLSQELFYGWGISVAALGINFLPAFANIPPSDMQCHG